MDATLKMEQTLGLIAKQDGLFVIGDFPTLSLP
jgi:hypothetical protein